mgnify:FL=1
MNKPLPDRWIRQAIHNVINNIIVDGETIPNFDYQITGNVIPSFYTLVTTQNNLVQSTTKCDDLWRSFTLVEIYTSYLGTTNPGSRLLADNITEAVLMLTDIVVLDVASGLQIITQNETVEPDLVIKTENQNVFRKFIRYEFLIT